MIIGERMKYYYLLVFALIFATGCLGSSNIQYDDSNGLRINSFTADPSTAEFDDSVRFFLDAENVGGTDVRCAIAELYGVSGENGWTDAATGTSLSLPVKIGDDIIDFDYVDGVFQICYSGDVVGDILSRLPFVSIDTRDRVCFRAQKGEKPEWTVMVNGVWNDFSGAICDAQKELSQQYKTIKVFEEITAPLPQRNRPGQSVQAEWLLRPPQLGQGIAVDYPVTARIKYFYTTTASVTLRAFSKSEFRRMQDTGQNTVFEADVVNSPGSPIKLVLTRGTSPIVVNTAAPSTGGELIEKANYLFEFQNVGTGFPLPIVSDNGESGLILGTVSVKGPGTFFYDCLGNRGGIIEGTGLSGDINGDSLYIIGQPLAKLRSDNSVPFGCTLGIDRNYWKDRPKDTIRLDFTLNYVYFVDKEINVKVLGSDEPINRPFG